jgi:hypothetical protein
MIRTYISQLNLSFSFTYKGTQDIVKSFWYRLEQQPYQILSKCSLNDQSQIKVTAENIEKLEDKFYTKVREF